LGDTSNGGIIGRVKLRCGNFAIAALLFGALFVVRIWWHSKMRVYDLPLGNQLPDPTNTAS
jgi:hypothetical protein